MITIREFVFENVGTAFISIRAGSVVQALAPGQFRSVSTWFKRADGSPDVEAARQNESVQQHVGSGALKLYEREYLAKIPHTRPFNETDPEETRIAKVLAHRRALKQRLLAADPVKQPDQVKHEEPKRKGAPKE